MPAERPNILILSTDQQRADALGCTGHPQLRTPNMDRLATAGVHFSRAITVSPLCMASRISFLTGQYPHNHHVWWNRGDIAAQDVSLFRLLRAGGYRTAHIGKGHYYSFRPNPDDFHLRDREAYMHELGFDYVREIFGNGANLLAGSAMTDSWRAKGLLEAYRQDYEKRVDNLPDIAVWPSPLPVEDFEDSYVGREAVKFIRDHDGRQPFAAFVGFPGPHEPWDAPGKYAQMYDPAQTPAPIPPAEPEDWVAPEAARWQRCLREPTMNSADVARLRANYYGKITLIDDWLGQIVQACAAKGGLDNLLIVFWSDHGEMLGDHQLLHKSHFFESSVRVPLLVSWPAKIRTGQHSDALVETLDIAPTVLEAAGIDIPARCMGKSLWPLLEENADQAGFRDAAFSEIHFTPPWPGHPKMPQSEHRRNFMVRTNQYKYAVDEAGQGYMLYNLDKDPREQNNLIGHPNERATENEMRDHLLKFLCRAHSVSGVAS